ncbi:MAG: MerR family transcriptional regulator [Actinomycetota bacterium]|nr:MerR family transcriptional regulator [Actinomycetota bacterium]
MPARPGVSLSIGGVLTQLQTDFPDLTISKIRFLETEGLVTPQRSASGYRSFSSADVDRLRYVLAAQRDQFWPLKVIREALDALDRGLTPPEGPPAPGVGRPRPPAATPDPDVPTVEDLTSATTRLRLTARELRSEAGLEKATFDALQTFGLLRADDEGHFDEDALAVARAAGALTAYGVEPRHLRPFRTAADREIGLVQHIVGPQRGARAGRRGTDSAAEVLRQCLALHTALVKAGLAG